MVDKTAYLKELTARDMSRMLIPERYWECTLDGISDEAIGVISPRTMVKRYLDRLDEFMAGGIGLLLWGANGRGKTGMAVVLAKWSRRHGYKVLFMEAAELKRCVIEKIAFDEVETMWERASMVDMLVLDDFGKGSKDRTGFGARVIDQLIRHRSANKRATMITTNMDTDQIADEMKESTMHTFQECIIPCHVEGVDRRNVSRSNLSDMLFGGDGED